MRELLLSPLLRTVAHSASMLPSGEGEFVTRFFVEHVVEARLGRRGRKPEVDYMIHGEMPSGNILYLIPVEAKSVISLVDAKELAGYMSRVMTCKEVAGKMLIGILFDQTDVRLPFSPLMVDAVPVPIVTVSA